MNARRLFVIATAFLCSVGLAALVSYLLFDDDESADQAAPDSVEGDGLPAPRAATEFEIYAPVYEGTDPDRLDEAAVLPAGTVSVPDDLLVPASFDPPGPDEALPRDLPDDEGGLFVEERLPPGEGIDVVEAPADDPVVEGAEAGDEPEAEPGFVDPCATAEDLGALADCPFGIGAEVVGAARDQVDGIDFELIVSPLGLSGGNVRCRESAQILGPFEAGIEPVDLLVRTSVPVHLAVERMWIGTDGVMQTADLDLGITSGSELEQWEKAVGVGELDDQNWIQTCISLAGSSRLQSLEIVARDAAGRSARWSESIVPGAGEVTGLHVHFQYSPDEYGYVAVASRVPAGADLEAFVYPIETATDDRDCADVRRSHLDGQETPLVAHPDDLVARALLHLTTEAEDADARTTRFHLPLRQGRQYSVCAFGYSLGGPGEPLTVVGLEEYLYTTASRRPVEVLLRGADVDAVGSVGSVDVLAQALDGGSGCDGTTRTGVAIDATGYVPIDQTLCRVEEVAWLGSAPYVYVYTEDERGNLRGGALEVENGPCRQLCDQGSKTVIGVPLDPVLCGGCDVTLIYHVDHLPIDGPTQPGFSIQRPDTLAMAGMTPPGSPEVVSSTVSAVPDVPGAFRLSLTTSVETDLTVSLRFVGFDDPSNPCRQFASASSSGVDHVLDFVDLCVSGVYWPEVVFTSTDPADGTMDVNVVGLDPVIASGIAVDVEFEAELVGVEDPDLVARVCADVESIAAAQGREGIDLGGDCHAGLALRIWESGAAPTYRCAPVGTAVEGLSDSFYHGGRVLLRFELRARLDQRCGAPVTVGWPDIEFDVELDAAALVAGSSFEVTDGSGLRWRIGVTEVERSFNDPEM